MSNTLVSFIFGIGVSGYVFKIIYKNTGGNTKSALIVAGVAGLFAMVAFLMLLNTLPFTR